MTFLLKWCAFFLVLVLLVQATGDLGLFLLAVRVGPFVGPLACLVCNDQPGPRSSEMRRLRR